jgi:hypothetical protein
MFLSVDIVAGNVPTPLVAPAFSTSVLERNTESNVSHTSRTLPEMTSGSLLRVRLRN